MVLKKYYILFIILVGLFSCTERKAQENNSNTISDSYSKQLYTLNCASCHGKDGRLGVAGAKDLSQTSLSDNEKKNIILKGQNGMPSFENRLEIEDIDSIIQYINNF
ncbi:MAG: c-type cytochrome [Crocinitomicaceae bacterium]